MSHSDEIARRNEAARNWQVPRFVNDHTDELAAMNLAGTLAAHAEDSWSNMSAAGNVVLALRNACDSYMDRLNDGESDQDHNLVDLIECAREAYVALDAGTADTHDDDDEADHHMMRMMDALNGQFQD